MKVYYLCKPGQDPVYELSNPLGESHVVRVRGDADWYAARARALEHAAMSGAGRCLVVVGHARPTQVLRTAPRDRRSLATTQPIVPSHLTDHALLTYLDRLLRQYAGAVLVPPYGATRHLPGGWAEQIPSVAMVAGYSIPAAMTCDYEDRALEYSMVVKGYRVLTLSDYGFDQFGDTVLDTTGTATSWKKAYENALRPFLG